jgi:hypothetical protein
LALEPFFEKDFIFTANRIWGLQLEL